MRSFDLTGPWTLTAATTTPIRLPDQGVAALVPGCVHIDLLRNGLIADPFDADNETTQQWIGDTDWRYERVFDWDPVENERIELVAEGLDTVAVITINGHVIGTTENQHRSYRFDLGAVLTRGRNHIQIAFAAPVLEVERRARSHGNLPHVNHHPYNMLRKAASNYGWDWGIDVATAGIWKPIRVETWAGARIATVRPLVDIIDDTGILDVHIDLARTDPHPVETTITLRRYNTLVATTSTHLARGGRLRVTVPDVERWWPRGYGAQPMYDLQVQAGPDSWTGRVGFRTIALDTTPDEHGSPMHLVVNDRKVLVRGANWIPDHAFFTEVTPERTHRRITDAIEANVNLLRVWGGGLYESEWFYDRCDDEGILVWQDMLLACAAYPEDAWLANEIEAEVREAVARLSPHPALVVWNGNNENLVAFAEWGWPHDLAGRTWGETFYRELFPTILAELDPSRVYTPGSPWSVNPYLTPNDQHDGSVHIWDVWNDKDYRDYRTWRPRFVAEFGFQGPPAWATLVGAVHDEPLRPDGDQMLIHQKAENGNTKLALGLLGHLAEPHTIEDWHFATQLNQAHAIRFGIEWFRALTPYNTGTILWQLNDNWPVVSWSAIDFAERRKPMWFALRDVYAPRLTTVQPTAALQPELSSPHGALTAVLLNDTDEPWTGPITFTRLSIDGQKRAQTTATVSIRARGSARVPIPARVALTTDPTGEILVVQPAPGFPRTIWHYAEVVDMRLDPSAAKVFVQDSGGKITVSVHATSYVFDLVILADRVDASYAAADSLITLLPGEQAEVPSAGLTNQTSASPRLTLSGSRINWVPGCGNDRNAWSSRN